MSDIVTGRVIYAPTPTPLASAGTGTVGRVFFDTKSVGVWSTVFRVGAHESVILSAYGLAGGEEVSLYKFSPIVHNIAEGDACCPPEPETDLPIIRAEVAGAARCDGWALNECSPFKILTLPGYYRLLLSEEAMAGNIHVEGEWVKGMSIPDSLKFGG